MTNDDDKRASHIALSLITMPSLVTFAAFKSQVNDHGFNINKYL